MWLSWNFCLWLLVLSFRVRWVCPFYHVGGSGAPGVAVCESSPFVLWAVECLGFGAVVPVLDLAPLVLVMLAWPSSTASASSASEPAIDYSQFRLACRMYSYPHGPLFCCCCCCGLLWFVACVCVWVFLVVLWCCCPLACLWLPWPPCWFVRWLGSCRGWFAGVCYVCVCVWLVFVCVFVVLGWLLALVCLFTSSSYMCVNIL